MLDVKRKILTGAVVALSVVSFSPELPSLSCFSQAVPKTVYAATSGSASDIISEITGNGNKGDKSDSPLDKDNEDTKYRSVTGIHLINNLCQNSDYKLTKDKYNKIKSKINPSSKTVEDYNTEDTRQNLIDTDSTTSYLISNNIISRFENFRYKNGKINFSTDPLVMPSDTNYTSKIYRKSDLYVALYKAVYGVIDSKPVVFNLPSMRKVNGSNSVVSDVVNYKGKEGTASFAEGDYWAYVSPNVYEQYLAKLLDKGLIDESELIQDNNHTFVSEYRKLSKKSVKPAWYNDGTVAYAGKNNKALGKSFTYNSKCKLKHKKYNYFVDEQIDEMEALSIIEDFMRLKVTNMISQKSIEQLFPEISVVHDKLLENTNTGCEAMLMGDSGYAIVGTKVIVSDDLIVHDAGDDVYYNLEIITSLLTNAYLKELDKKIGNQITSLYISDSSLNESRYKVYSDSTLLNKTDVIQLKVKNNSGAEKSTKFFNMDSMCRGMNTASRVFKLKDSQGRDASVTVIVDLDFVVPSSTAFADGKLSTYLLNGPLTANNIAASYFNRPSDSEPDLQNWWDSNIGCSNALYNFLYGTNGIVYVESGYLAPSMTILKSSDAITDKQVSQIFKNFRLYDINGISYKKFFGNDLDKFWEFYFDANANTGLTNLSKTLAKDSRKFQQIVGTNSTSGINYQGKFFITNANTIYRSLDNADDVVTKNLKVDHNSKRIDLTTKTTSDSTTQPSVGDKIQYEYSDGNKNKKTTTWTYCGIKDGYYVLMPDINLMKNASSTWKKGSPVLQTAGGSAYTISSLATDNTIQYYLKQFYKVGFPDIWDKIDVSGYTTKTASSKLWKVNASMFGDNGFSQGRDQQYYLSGGKVYSRQIVSKDGKRVNTLAEVSHPSDDMNVAAVPIAYIPTGDISVTTSSSGNNIVFKANAGYKGTALHYGNVFLKNINQSVIDYSVYKSMKTKKINELNDNDTIYIGTTLFCKKGEYFVSSPITSDELVAIAKDAGTTSIKGQAVGIFMGLKVRVDGAERNLSDYVIDADTGTLFNEGNGENGIVYKQGGTVKVWKDNTAQGTEIAAKQICIKVKFDDNLLCRPINDKGNAYTLLYANTYLGSESLGNLPFLSEKLDYDRFSNVNATLSMSKFNLSEFAKVAKKEFLKRFRDRFFDDSRGLIYNIIIALASYLTVISWLVYGILRYGIGRHLLEMIANPTRMQSFRGIDLIKVFTLGIYNLDTEPTLARFFTTSLINVAIIYVVMFVLPH